MSKTRFQAIFSLRNFIFLPAILAAFSLLFFGNKAQAVTLNSTQIDYSTTADITTNGAGISSTFSGTSGILNRIKNLHFITANAGTTPYGIKSSGNYNYIINSVSGTILTTANSGRGISVVNNSLVNNDGNIITQGTTSYGIYAGGNANSIINSRSIQTSNSTSYGIYLNGDNNTAVNRGSISTQVYGIYLNGNVNNALNFSNITTSVSTSAHGIYVSAGSSFFGDLTNHSGVANFGNITSSGHGIYAKDNFTEITNLGSIISGSGSSINGIRNEGDNSVVTNIGSVTSSNYAIYNSGNFVVINNSGSFNGGVRLGNSTLNIFGGNISGKVDGDGTSNINIGASSNPNITFNQNADFNDIDNLNINNGSVFNATFAINANTISLGSNSVLNLNNSATTSAQIQGTNNLEGTLNINGNDFVVNGGIASLNHSLANLNINSGSLSSGGNIYAGNILINDDLNFSAANNLTIFGNVVGGGQGTINIGEQNQIIAGNFSLNSGDSLALTLKDNGPGSLTVNNIAVIDANSKLEITNLINQNNITGNSSYNIVSAAVGSNINPISDSNIFVNGSNSNIFGLLKFSTSSDANNLILNINRLAAKEVTTNQNSRNIYQALHESSNNSTGKMLEFQQYLDASGLNGEELNKALEELAPSPTKASLNVTNNVVNNSLLILENRMADQNHIIEVASASNNLVGLAASDNLNNSVWGQFFGSTANQKAVGDDVGYKTNSSGFAAGIDQKTDSNTLVGAALGLAKSLIKDEDKKKRNLINTYQISFYASRNFDSYFIDGIGGIALNQFHSERQINAVNSSASADYFGQAYFLKVKSGFTKNLANNFKLTPEISLNFLRNNIGGFSEKGASDLNLKVDSVSANFIEGRAGLNLGHEITLDPKSELQKFASNFKISYGHFFINDSPKSKVTFSNYQNGFDSNISHQDKNSIKFGIGVTAYFKEDVTWNLDYDLEHKTTSDSHFMLFKIRQKF